MLFICSYFFLSFFIFIFVVLNLQNHKLPTNSQIIDVTQHLFCLKICGFFFFSYICSCNYIKFVRARNT